MQHPSWKIYFTNKNKYTSSSSSKSAAIFQHSSSGLRSPTFWDWSQDPGNAGVSGALWWTQSVITKAICRTHFHTHSRSGPPRKFPVSLQKQVKSVSIYRWTSRRVTDTPHREIHSAIQTGCGLTQFMPRLYMTKAEPGAVCHRWHLWRQEVLLQVTGHGSLVGFSLTAQLMFRNCLNMFCTCWQIKTFSVRIKTVQWWWYSRFLF